MPAEYEIVEAKANEVQVDWEILACVQPLRFAVIDRIEVGEYGAWNFYTVEGGSPFAVHGGDKPVLVRRPAPAPSEPGDGERDPSAAIALLAKAQVAGMAIHHAINAAERERGGSYRTTHLTARVLGLLREAGWALVGGRSMEDDAREVLAALDEECPSPAPEGETEAASEWEPSEDEIPPVEHQRLFDALEEERSKPVAVLVGDFIAHKSGSIWQVTDPEQDQYRSVGVRCVDPGPLNDAPMGAERRSRLDPWRYGRVNAPVQSPEAPGGPSSTGHPSPVVESKTGRVAPLSSENTNADGPDVLAKLREWTDKRVARWRRIACDPKHPARQGAHMRANEAEEFREQIDALSSPTPTPGGEATSPAVASIELRRWDGTEAGLRDLSDWAGNDPTGEPQFSWITATGGREGWTDPMLGNQSIKAGDLFAKVNGWVIPARPATPTPTTQGAEPSGSEIPNTQQEGERDA